MRMPCGVSPPAPTSETTRAAVLPDVADPPDLRDPAVGHGTGIGVRRRLGYGLGHERDQPVRDQLAVSWPHHAPPAGRRALGRDDALQAEDAFGDLEARRLARGIGPAGGEPRGRLGRPEEAGQVLGPERVHERVDRLELVDAGQHLVVRRRAECRGHDATRAVGHRGELGRAVGEDLGVRSHEAGDAEQEVVLRLARSEERTRGSQELVGRAVLPNRERHVAIMADGATPGRSPRSGRGGQGDPEGRAGRPGGLDVD